MFSDPSLFCYNTVKPLILAFESNYFGPRNFGIFASYYTETLLYSNFCGPLFSRTCQAREIKGTRKKWVLQYLRLVSLHLLPKLCTTVVLMTVHHACIEHFLFICSTDFVGFDVSFDKI